MDYEEIVCVHLNLKFLIFENIEKDENCLCNDFVINLANIHDIEVNNSSKEYFIKKFHGVLKKKKRNEYECILSGTLTEIANFLFQHIELFIEIKKSKYNSGDNNRDKDINTNEKINDIDINDKKKLKKNKIHLLKSVDTCDDFNFEKNSIYFKCPFNDLINDFEFFENKKYENISNFYISNDLIFSICLKLEEYLIEKKDLEKIKLNTCMNLEKYDHKYKHILNIFNLDNLFYLYIHFDDYNKQFFHDNHVEITVGEMMQNLSNKVLKNGQNDILSNSINKLTEEKKLDDFNVGCHFSLILIDDVKELYDYFCINDLFINFNKTKLNIDKSVFSNTDDKSESWTHYKNFKKITYNLSTLNGSYNLNFNISIISILINSESCNKPSSFDHIDNALHPDYKFTNSYNTFYKNISTNSSLDLTKNKELSKMDLFLCNFFLSVKSCHILELSNIYAEKKKKNQNYFFIKIESNFFEQTLTSPLYLFQEDTQIELTNCYINHDFDLKGENLHEFFANKIIYFDLSIKEKDSDINIGKGNFSMKTIVNELKDILEEKKIQNYYKFNYNVSLFLNVFKEKYLTSELSVEIFFSMKERKVETNRDNNILTVESKCINYEIPKNIYEFKIWKEQEEKNMKNILKKKEENLVKKFIKKYELMERERKNELEIKKNELKEIVIKMKEEQINIINSNNAIILKDKELNEEIHSLEKKLKKIKYAYEKSLHTFKENLRKTNLNESMIKENSELKMNYTKLITENKQLKKENEQMMSALKKYNHKDNTIISNTYFEKLKDELKQLKENKNKMKEVKMDSINDKMQNYIKRIHKNRKKVLQLITNFTIQLEDIYDLTNDEILEGKFQSILEDINAIKLIINEEMKEEKVIKDKDLIEFKSNNADNNNNSINNKNIFYFNKNKNVDNNMKEKDTKNFLYNKKSSIKEKEKNKNTNQIFTKNVSIKENKKSYIFRNQTIEGSNKKKNVNTKVVENLKSEIKRLIESGIYNEDDQIIINMKKKLISILNNEK